MPREAVIRGSKKSKLDDIHKDLETALKYEWYKPDVVNRRASPWGETWHADMAPVFPFGETIFTSMIKSVETEHDLSQDPDPANVDSRTILGQYVKDEYGEDPDPRYLIPTVSYFSLPPPDNDCYVLQGILYKFGIFQLRYNKIEDPQSELQNLIKNVYGEKYGPSDIPSTGINIVPAPKVPNLVVKGPSTLGGVAKKRIRGANVDDTGTVEQANAQEPSKKPRTTRAQSASSNIKADTKVKPVKKAVQTKTTPAKKVAKPKTTPTKKVTKPKATPMKPTRTKVAFAAEQPSNDSVRVTRSSKK